MARKRVEHIAEKPAGELVQQFSSCGKYPIERAGVEALARALERAAMDTGIMMQAIVDECLSTSSWCPTPFDVRTIAGQMKQRIKDGREANVHAKWREIYGQPNPQWATDLLAELMAPTHPGSRAKLHERAIRDMLYYTEGDGQQMGDQKFWREARERDIRDHQALVEKIRAAGGWRTERELQGVA
jgi:hypothetical protein